MDIRQQILDQATRLFAAQGFKGTSLADISAAVGIRKPSLLYHFPSKEDLRQAVLDQMLSHWSEALPRLMAAAAREDQFEAVMHALCSFFLEDPDRARLMVREVLDRPGDMRDLLRRHVRPWVLMVATQIEKGRLQGLVHENVDPEAYCLQVIHLVVGGVAILDSMVVLLDDDASRGDARERHIRELIRVARSSLYVAG